MTSWDERLFNKFYGTIRKAREATAGKQEMDSSIEVEFHRLRLQILAQAISGCRVQIALSEIAEDCTSHLLVLPKRFSISSDRTINERGLLFRVLCYAMAVKQGYHFDPLSGTKRESHISSTIKHRLQITTALMDSFPGLEWLPIFLASIESHDEWIRFAGRLPLKTIRERSQDALKPDGSLMQPEERSDSSQDLEIRSLVRPKQHKLSHDAENPLVHVFEKVLTAEEYQGGNKNLDGEDQSSEHQEALRELILGDVIRSDERASGFFKSNAWVESQIPDAQDRILEEVPILSLPEWFGAEKRYRENWCSVYECQFSSGTRATGLGEGAISSSKKLKAAQRAKKMWQQLFNSELWRGRQQTGTDLDLDVVIRNQSQFKAGIPPDPRIYLNRCRLEKDVAILILVDVSTSTDSWVGNRRVLNVLQQAVQTMGTALDDFDDLFSIAGFYSHTRHRCSVGWLKRFDEAWPVADKRLSCLVPQGYTRMGPAIRWATKLLMERRARRRALFLVTDGKPSDLDRYEGRYGVADVAMAIREAEAKAVQCMGFIAADGKQKEPFKIFHPHRVIPLKSEMDLVNGVIHAFCRILRK